jgi:hypothetical protein
MVLDWQPIKEIDMSEVYKLSNGLDSTVGNWIDIATSIWGENSKQVELLKSRISDKNGLSEVVIVEETQLLYLLAGLGGNK